MKNEQLPTVVDLATIRTRIYNVRGKNVMIDKDLAVLYGVETKKLNQAVKRNMERFPEDFLFQLTKEECLRSQFVTLNMEQGTHLKYMPYAFTELGVAMLSSSQIPKNKRNQLPENNSQFIMHNSQLITHNS